MFIPGGCFCCDPPEDPCTLSGCTWTSTDMSDTDLTAGTAYYNPVSGTTPDGSYEITNAQETGTGNDAPCRKITIETVEAPQKPDTVYAICWKDDATFTPTPTCELLNVSFCVESKRHIDSDSGLTDSVVFVVRQGGRVYVTSDFSIGANWKRASGTFISVEFTEVNGTNSPNFTATGSVIEFGFALKLQVSEDEEPNDVVMFDNLCITTPCKNCLTDGCEKLMDAAEATLVSSHTRGVGAYTTTTVSVDYTDGSADAPCLTIINTPAGTSVGGEAHAGAWDIVSLDGFSFDPDPCGNITGIRVCANLRMTWDTEPVGADRTSGPSGYFASVVFQDGKTFINPFFGFGIAGGFQGGWGVNRRQVVTLSHFRELVSFCWPSFCSSGVNCGITGGCPVYNTSSVPDFSQPFTYGLAIYTKCWGAGSGPVEVKFKIDDYCVNVTRDC